MEEGTSDMVNGIYARYSERAQSCLSRELSSRVKLARFFQHSAGVPVNRKISYLPKPYPFIGLFLWQLEPPYDTTTTVVLL